MLTCIYLIGGGLFITWASHPADRVVIPTSGLILMALIWPVILAFWLIASFAYALRGGE